jgi:hypothetical protein
MPSGMRCKWASAAYFLACFIHVCGGYDSVVWFEKVVAARRSRTHCHTLGILQLRGGVGDVAMMDSSAAARPTFENMSTTELRAELGRLGLDTMGARSLLLIRLERAIREGHSEVIPQKIPQQHGTASSFMQTAHNEGDMSMEVDTGESKRHGPRRLVLFIYTALMYHIISISLTF